MRRLFAVVSVLALSACGLNGTDRYKEEEGQQKSAAAAPTGADAMASNDAGTETIPDSEARPMMQAQVVLDRLGFTPGVVDGKMGLSTENALKGFQESRGLTVSGQLDEATRQELARYQRIPATRVVTIPQDWGQENYQPIPEDPAEKAKLEKLGYTSLDERLAERFHTTVDVLKQLNPGGRPAGAPAGAGAAGQPGPAASASPSATTSPSPSGSASPGASPSPSATPSVFRPGQQIRVPNIGGDRIDAGNVSDQNWLRTLVMLGVGSEQPKAARIVVSKAAKTMKVYDAQEKLVAMFTVSTGSSKNPLPLGNWKILGTSFNPTYSYDPEVLDSVEDSGEKHQFPAGPNSPVGVVWIDLSKEHYGLHGTPEPQTIGRAQSDGCVRLTNWDAARLAQMVSGDTKVEFVA